MSRSGRLAVPARHAGEQTRTARRFFIASVGVMLLAAMIARVLQQGLGREPAATFVFPRAFAVSTLLLGLGSFSLARALRYVRREKQRLFRRWLLTGLAAGTLFIGVQSYALWCLRPVQRTAVEAQAGVTTFVLMFAALHALHFTVAALFLVFVTLQAFADRYDHEYHWGVTVCAGFWHALGIAWLAILAVCAIAV